jgi:hypothetical protein
MKREREGGGRGFNYWAECVCSTACKSTFGIGTYVFSAEVTLTSAWAGYSVDLGMGEREGRGTKEEGGRRGGSILGQVRLPYDIWNLVVLVLMSLLLRLP